MDEAALLCPVSGLRVLEAQLHALVDLSKEPDITLQIVRTATAASGGYLPSTGPFTLLRFTDSEQPDMLYVHHLVESTPLDGTSDVDAYLRAHNHLCVAAELPNKTVDILTEMRVTASRTP